MKKYEKTFWRYSPKGVSEGFNPNYLFAVVKNLNTDIDELLAWQIEIRSFGLYHPYHGLIPFEYVDKFDMFIKEEGIIFPRFYFRDNDQRMMLLGEDLDLTKLKR